MDKGAHFYRTDFQVHTPRDLRWSGAEATTDAERKAYAEELILACRQKGLRAIAITDHHDFAFFPYAKRAAQEELDEAGKPVHAEDRIIVFPGLELTLTAPNCQALLILDADFPENLLQSVLTVLAITAAPTQDAKQAPVQRIPQAVISDLRDLYDKLSNLDHLRGRFTVLPNVSETGHGTMLRSGFANFYKTMPCVGGYTDGPVSNFGKGNLSIVSGQNRDYGFKAIGVFQTSDNRRRDHSDLGKHTTWVKWSEPTAEALRQACLAKESRLSQDDPEIPALWISSISVSNSKFLSRVELEFNPQYNAVIGGRGTGKSTILEYLRWGLCDQPVEVVDSDIAPVQTRRKKLIDDTLRAFDGEVIVTFLLNDVKHIIRRNSKTQEILLKIGDGEFVQTTEEEVRNLFPAQAYSQKQLSSVGVRIEELKRFVELPIKQALDQIRAEIRDTEAKIRSTYGNLIRKRRIEGEIAKYNLEIISLTEQVERLRAALKGLSADDQDVIGQKPKYDNEELVVENLKNRFERAKQLITTVSTQFGNLARAEDDALEVQNPDTIRRIQDAFAAKFREVEAQIATLSNLFAPPSTDELNAELAKWDELKAIFDVRYEDAKTRATANQHQLDQIRSIERRAADLNRVQSANRTTIAELGSPEADYLALRAKWNELHASKISIVAGQCQTFSSLSVGLIKADIVKGLDGERLKEKIKGAFARLNIREQKIDDMCRAVVEAADPLAAWGGVLSDLETLAVHDTAGTDPLPTTPLIDRCGFVPSEKERLAKGLDAPKWLELSVTELEFNPRFQYCTNKDTKEYIAFADASAGQQATALLTVLLNQPGAPLLIDQPEDDVDSKMAPEIVQQIWSAKKRRQLIFASHNANFVVNGDSELVVVCDYVKAGDQTGGQIKASGAIDNRVIKEEITAVTEGGKEAFQLRMEKYGF